MQQTPCLVTGGAGFIGSNLVRALLDKGFRVRVLDNLSTGRIVNLDGIRSRIDWREGDLRDRHLLRQAVQGMRYVFHLAALPSVARSVEDPVSTHDVNVTGTLHLLMEARDAGVERLVFASSSSVYGDTPRLPKHEGLPTRPLSPYALSKLAGEHYARIFFQLYGLKTFALRFFNVFGPRQDPESHYAAVIPRFINALRKDQSPTINGDGKQTRDFTYVDDVVAAMMACGAAPDAAAGAVYNVARGDRISVNTLARELAAILGKHIKAVHGPARPGDVRHSQADASRAREALDWRPAVSFEEGLRRTVAWFVSADPRAARTAVANA